MIALEAKITVKKCVFFIGTHLFQINVKLVDVKLCLTKFDATIV